MYKTKRKRRIPGYALDVLKLTPTARAEYTKEGHVYHSRADGEGGLHAWVALPLSRATGPHSVARSKRKRRIPKHLGYASPLTQTPPTFSFQPTNQIRRGTQKDRFDWSPSVTLGGSLAREHKSDAPSCRHTVSRSLATRLQPPRRPHQGR